MPVPLFDPETPRAGLRRRLLEAAEHVLADGRFILGPEVDAFERELATAFGTAHAVGVANGTDAITLALRAVGVGPGDEVVVPSFSFYASAEAIPPTGARPVFCDVDVQTRCLTAETVRAVLTPRTQAVLAVHLLGNVAPVGEIAALGVPVVEDAAQAAGARAPEGRAGALGTIATLSFYPSKNLGAFGDGGAVLTSDAGLADHVRMLRFHGSRDQVEHEAIGVNSRLDELQAALLRVQLPELDRWSAHRRRVADWYAAAGLGEHCSLPVAGPGVEPAWHLYLVGHPRADEILPALAQAGIGARAYYRTPIHRQPAMAAYAAGVSLPVTDALAREALALPMSAAMTAGQVDEVVTAVVNAPVPAS